MPAKQVLKPNRHAMESRPASTSAGSASAAWPKSTNKPKHLTSAHESPNQFACTEQKASGWLKLYPVALLAILWLLAFSIRLFSVIRFEAIIHEFDPWFNFRASVYMVQNGFYNFLNWFDDRAWYPLGRIVGGTVYPGLMLTSGFIHYVTSWITVPISIRDICVFLSPFFSGMTAIATFLFTRELWNTGAGLFAAGFIGIAPGYISRSVAGSYDNEGIAIFALMFVYFLWMKSVATGSVMWSALCAVAYAYMVAAWGGYVFIINLVPLHVFVLLLMGRYSNRIYVAYNTFFIMGTLLSMQVPFVGFQPVRTSEHMAAFGVFAVLNAYGFLQYIQQSLKVRFEVLLMWLAVAALTFAAVVGLTMMGVIAPWSGRFYSLWDTGYAKIHIPIIASVSEHQPTTWTSFIFDLHFLICAFPAGAYFCVKDINDLRVFIILYALTATYFSGVMVRLVLTLTPVVCVLAGIAVSEVCSRYFSGLTLRQQEKQSNTGGGSNNKAAGSSSTSKSTTSDGARLFDDAAAVRSSPDQTSSNTTTASSSSSSNTVLPSRVSSASVEDDTGIGMMVRNLVFVCLCALLMLFVMHCTWITSNAYSSPSVVLATYGQNGERELLDDFREAYYWLRMNTVDDARVMSWWDYGYQIAGFANRTTLVDNNTWNNSHIAMVGKAMASNETAAYTIMQSLDVDYVLVIFGGLIGYSGDDINKFLWMVRIAEGEHPQDIRESNYFTPDGQYRVDSAAPATMTNSLMYRLSYYRFGEVSMGVRSPSGYDRTRGSEIGKKNIKLKYLEEAFTSEHWLVRVYKVKHVFNRGFKTRPLARGAAKKK